MNYSKLVELSAKFFREDLQPFESPNEVLKLYVKHIQDEMNRMEVLSWREPVKEPSRPA